MTRQQFAKYGLLRLGEDISRIVRNGVPRHVAPTEGDSVPEAGTGAAKLEKFTLYTTT